MNDIVLKKYLNRMKSDFMYLKNALSGLEKLF